MTIEFRIAFPLVYFLTVICPSISLLPFHSFITEALPTFILLSVNYCVGLVGLGLWRVELPEFFTTSIGVINTSHLLVILAKYLLSPHHLPGWGVGERPFHLRPFHDGYEKKEPRYGYENIICGYQRSGT
jgi:hypothetical protein